MKNKNLKKLQRTFNKLLREVNTRLAQETNLKYCTMTQVCRRDYRDASDQTVGSSFDMVIEICDEQAGYIASSLLKIYSLWEGQSNDLNVQLIKADIYRHAKQMIRQAANE